MSYISGGMGVLGSVVGGVNSWYSGEQQLEGIKRGYEYEKMSTFRNLLNLQQDYAGSRSELEIEGLDVAGQLLSLESARGVRDLSKRADPTRKEKINLFSNLTHQQQQIRYNLERAGAETRQRAKATKAQENANIASSIASTAFLAFALL